MLPHNLCVVFMGMKQKKLKKKNWKKKSKMANPKEKLSNGCPGIYYIKVELLQQLFGNFYIFYLQKIIVVVAIIWGNTYLYLPVTGDFWKVWSLPNQYQIDLYLKDQRPLQRCTLQTHSLLW